MEIKAALDIGTNSVRLLVASCQEGLLKPLRKELRTTRLGEGVHRSGYLSGQAMKRTIEAVTELAGVARSSGASEIAAVATSAVRDAANGREFVEQCLQQAGIIVHILSGRTEGQLSFLGAVYGQPDAAEAMVIDIGGGSTELAYGRNKQLINAQSLNLGAVRLKDLFPSREDGIFTRLADVREYVCHVLQDTEPFPADIRLTGVGGTITSLAAIDQQLRVYDPDKVHGYFLSTLRINDLLVSLASLPLDKRKAVAGLQPQRADIIVYGTAVLAYMLQHLGAEGITVSERDILEGIIAQQYLR